MIDSLPALFIKDLASICQSHNEEDLYDSKKYPIKRNYGNTPQETANVFFVISKDESFVSIINAPLTQ